MAEDIKQLTQYLEEKFEKIDERFDGVDKRLDSFEKEVGERFNEVDEKFILLCEICATKEEMQEMRKEMMTQNDKHQILMAVDSYAKRSDTYFQEMVMLSHKVDRHEKWFQIFAERLGLKLEY